MIEKDLKRIKEVEAESVHRMEKAAASCEERHDTADLEGKKRVEDAISSAKTNARGELETLEKDLKTTAETLLSRAEKEAGTAAATASPRVPKAAKDIADKVLSG